MKYQRIYFVDCENVGSDCSTTKPTDLVVYFTSNKYRVQHELSKNEKEVHIKHNGMKDSLDFIIDSTLGYYMMHYGRNVKYYIISRDKGYEIMKSYWGSLGYSITLIEYLNFTSNFKVSSKDDFVAVSLINGLSPACNRKVSNIYQSWYRSKARDYTILRNQLTRSLHKCLSSESISIICDYLYERKEDL